MRIGLLGFGVVGKGLYDLAQARPDMEVVKVLCLEDIQLPDATVTKNFQDILTDDSIDTVIEAMGGLHPAYEFVRSAMEAGKNIVTSNKALIAHYYEELVTLAAEKGLKLRCTAAVGGGICWLSELERSRRAQKITQVGGIMNGTCNYILDAMTRSGLPYADALAPAQALGYAEANPTTDVEGIDTWNKLIISSNIAFGVIVDRESVPVTGISRIQAADVARFTEHGLVCKLVSTGKLTEDGLQAYVQPTLFPIGAPESAVPTNYNLITLVGEASGRQSLYGQGAGRYPTAYNVLQDCIDLMAGKGFYTACGEKVAAANTEKLCYYVRAAEDAWIQANTDQVWGDAVITEPVRVSRMHSWLKAHPDAFVAALNAG